MLSVIIPAKHEAENLRELMPRLAAVLNRLHAELIIVCPADRDVDCNWWPTDGTYEVVTSHWPAAEFVPQTRKGKGNALACGFAEAEGEFIIIMDADGSHDPEEIFGMLEALEDGNEFVKGTRFMYGGSSEDFTPIRRVGAWMLTSLFNLLFGAKHTDLCYGFMGFRADMLGDLDLPVIDGDEPQWGDGFEIETLINTGMARAAARTVEVPSDEAKRAHGSSNLHTFRDGFRALRTLLAERRKPRYFKIALSEVPDPSTIFGPIDPSMIHTDPGRR